MLDSTIAIGITAKMRNAELTRFSCRSGYSTENRTGWSSIWISFGVDWPGKSILAARAPGLQPRAPAFSPGSASSERVIEVAVDEVAAAAGVVADTALERVEHVRAMLYQRDAARRRGVGGEAARVGRVRGRAGQRGVVGLGAERRGDDQRPVAAEAAQALQPAGELLRALPRLLPGEALLAHQALDVGRPRPVGAGELSEVEVR